MAFYAPTRNLSCNYWRNATFVASWLSGSGVVPPPDFTVDVQLRNLRHGPPFGTPVEIPPSEVIFEAGVDVRVPVFTTGEYYYYFDLLEVPAGTGCFYFVAAVVDVAKGFSNEYRVAWCLPSWVTDSPIYSSGAHWPYAPAWPVPIP